MHLVGYLYYLYQWCAVKQILDNEIYLLIKYIKSVLWRVAKRLSNTEDAVRCLKVNNVFWRPLGFPPERKSLLPWLLQPFSHKTHDTCCHEGKWAVILEFGTKWRWALSFTLRPLYRDGKSLWHQQNRRASKTGYAGGRFGETRSPMLLLGIRKLSMARPRRRTDILLTIWQLIKGKFRNNEAYTEACPSTTLAWFWRPTRDYQPHSAQPLHKI